MNKRQEEVLVPRYPWKRPKPVPPPVVLEVGAKHHHMTVVSMKPFVVECVCGKTITKYKPSHLRTGRVRSCGCMKVDRSPQPGMVFGTIKVLRCLNPQYKVISRAYDVECLKCGHVQIMAHTSVNARYQREIGCQNCVWLHKEKKRRSRPQMFSTRIVLEPGVEAAMRVYCDKNNMPIITFIRKAMANMLETATPEEAQALPSHADIYGKLSTTSFSIDITANEKHELERFGMRMKVYMSRSIAKLIRFAITRFCRQLSSSSHDEAPTTQ